jgi:hypothetical protein
MDRIEYDPEIDPSIREEREAAERAREAAERERELTARIRVEIDRYVADNDLIPREREERDAAGNAAGDATRETVHETAREAANETANEAKRAAREAREAAREVEKQERSARAATRRKAMQSLFTGNILQTEQARRMWPYLLGVAVVLVFYIAYNFHVAGLHLERQRLEREVRELGIEAVERTATRVRQTRRSAIVQRLKDNDIPLEEFPHPVKRIER